MTDPTTRFSDRVDDYVRSRPTYPPGVIDLLRRECGLARGSIVADVGSGTGIFSRLLLDAGATVLAVEPNDAMRQAAERELGGVAGFTSVDGTASDTTLPAASVDIVTAAQAFHWFDPEAFQAECRRILRPGGSVLLVWNERRTQSTPFLREYEQLLCEHAVDYAVVDHRQVDPAIGRFFDGGHETVTFGNAQDFDLEGFLGRVRSSSYVPGAGHPGHAQFMERARGLFTAHARAGVVRWEYDTTACWGRLG